MGRTPQVVDRVEDEERVIGRCACQTPWRLASNTVNPVAGRWHDSVTVCCPECGQRREFVFDITPFFSPRPGIWGHAAAL